MATLGELREAVKTTVQDTSIADETIDALINEGYAMVAEEILLPDLETSATVTTAISETVVDLPANFGRNLYGCSIASQSVQPSILSSMGLMQRRYPAIEAELLFGKVKHICSRGGQLVYHPIPETATDILIRFYASVTPLTADSESPDALPLAYQRKLLVSYACMNLFDDIEDGMEGQKINTARHEGKWSKALIDLENRLKQGQSRSRPAGDMNQWML